MACTSPPYWGLRSYGIPPIVWGGVADCVHSFQLQDSTHTRSNPGGEGINRDRGFDDLYEQQHGFCPKCGAWQGQLGMEPKPELYVKHLVEVMKEVWRVLRNDGILWLNLGDSYWGSWGNSGNRPELDGKWCGQRERNAEYIPRRGWKDHRERLPASYKHDQLKPKDLVGIPWRVAFALRDVGWYLRSDVIWAKENCMPESVADRPTKAHEYIFLLAKSERYFYDAEAIREFSSKEGMGRNKRSVWNVNPRPYPGAHFAVWPSELVELMILAGTSAKGSCPQCGAPWRRDSKGIETVDWQPICDCGDHQVARSLVLDPFSGSGTTGMVALRLGRDYIGVDLNANYLPLACARIQGQDAPEREMGEEAEAEGIFDLFGES
jgi:DNA modification methylase